MCGFAAQVSTDGSAVDPTLVARMTEVIRHRGPDDHGFHVEGHVGFGFRRLSILDLSPAGHQPMVGGDGRFVLVFNGEIFNYVELRAQLQAKGHRFVSTGDTEVLLHAYMEWGAECLPRLNGMWAFLIHDRAKGTVFGSRDRFGIKPLYRHRTPRGVLFASEIKAIRASGECSTAPNPAMLAQFLSGQSLDMIDRGTETFFQNIEEVPAGSAFELRADGGMEEWRFWSLEEIPPATIADPAEAFREMFTDAVRLRLRSDVPVGVSLSGGLDSTAIISTMARQLAAGSEGAPAPRLNAFSYIAEEFDESPYIAETVRQTGATFHPVDVDPLRLWDGLERALWFHDEPVHTLNALISFEIYRMAAAEGVRVMLCGQGADETIGGYPSYFPDRWHTLLRGGHIASAWREVSAHTAAFGGDRRSTFARAARRLVQMEARRLEPYRALAERRRRARAGGHPWLSAELLASTPLPTLRYEPGTLTSALRWSTRVAPLPLYLRLEDRNSMAHSVEARVPFLDYRLVTMAFQLPDEWKLSGPWNKQILRESMRGVIPETVRTRLDKMGYPIPLDRWVRGPLYEPLQDLLGSAAVRDRGIYDVGAIRADLERHRRGETDVAKALLNVAQAEIWFGLSARTPSETAHPAASPPAVATPASA